MNANLRALVAVCDRLGVRHERLHRTGNLVRVHTPTGAHLFANWTTPVNNHAVARLCEDKDYAYAALSTLLPMPATRAYLNPEVEATYQHYVEHRSHASIVDAIEVEFAYPLILKRNRGSHGSNVFAVADRAALAAALRAVFDQGSKHYDYVALAQAYVDIAAEYRAVFLGGRLELAYRKETRHPRKTGNLSPFQRSGTRAVLVSDSSLLAEMECVIGPSLTATGIVYAGVDVVRDRDGALWVLELNSSPGFEHFVASCGTDRVERLYERMLMEELGVEAAATR